MKKQLTLLLVLMLVVAGLHAQSTSKLYGFSQIVIPGTAKRERNENGTTPERKKNYSYQVYLTSPLTTRIYPIELWIKGERFSVREEAVSSTPVEHTNFTARNPEPVILVPKTADQVVRLIPTPYTGIKNYPQARQLAATNEVVAVYRQAGKIHYKTLKSLTELEPQAMQ